MLQLHGGLRPPDPLPGLRPWTPLGDFRPPDPLLTDPPLISETPQLEIPGKKPALRSGKKDKEHPSAYDCMRAEKVMEGEPDKGHPLGLNKRHPGKSQQPDGDSDLEVEPGSSFRHRCMKKSFLMENPIFMVIFDQTLDKGCRY